MTPPSRTPPRRGVVTPTPAKPKTNTRGAHSARRAAKYRQRFDQYRQGNPYSEGGLHDVESWQAEQDLNNIDPTIASIEDMALRDREQKSVVPRIGTMATAKPDGVWRIAYCQLNNMSGSHTRRCKIKELERIVQDFDVDGLSLCEIGVNWRSGRGHSLKSWCSPYFQQEIRCSTAHNIHSPKSSLSQPGGTGVLLTQSLLEYAHTTETDPRGLGRWTSWKLFHTPQHATRLITAYCPCTGSTDKGLKTVYRQHLTYIQKEQLNRTPYQLFFDDLVVQLKKWRSEGERLILCIDLNEHSIRGKISRRLRSDDIELIERTHDFWPEGMEPNTYIDGSRPIDGIFATPDIDVTNCLLLSFHESVGDHRTMIMEFTTASAIGRFQGRIVRPSSRRLTLRQPGAINSYNNTIHEQFTIHRIPERLSTLLLESKRYSFPPPPVFQARCNTIHEQITQIRLHAESTCRKILKPALEFSPTVQFWYDRAHAYILLIKIKSGKAKTHTDISRAIRFAARKRIPDPRSLTLEQCKDGLTACKLRQKELRRMSTSLRRQFSQSIISDATAAGDTNRAKAMKERMQRERSTTIWRRINRVTRPSRGRACREVQRSIGNRVQTFTTKESVESNIQLECASRFQLGYSAPIASTLLGNELQYLQDIELAYSILMGTYAIPPHLDFPTQLILREIAKLGKSILMGSTPADITITGADYIRYWQKIKDRTSSSPSGVHVTHYKASALDPTLADHFALQMNLIIRSGVHPLRWGSALQVMLEKVAGICLVDKLRSIQLYEADLNWFMKFIFNDIALTKLEETSLLPEEHYSNKGSTSEDACFEKTLTFDISRQSRTPMATISVDAAQCYDRVHPALMSLVWLALTNHPHSVILLLHVLQHMKIYTRTGFGDSSTYFGGPDETPLCGLGQGSKAAPAAWLQLSSMIVNAYKEQGCSSTVKDPITGDLTKSIGCMFVDDTDLYCMSPLLLTAVLVVTQAQRCVSIWSNLLNATGGAIKGSKSFWYLIDYECQRGNWTYKQFNDSTHNLFLDQADGNSSQLERKAPDDAIKTLGVFHSPAGDHNHHLQHLQRRSSDWLNNIRNGHLPSSYVLLSYHQQLWPGLRYGLGTLSNSLLSAEDCLCKFDYHLLPYIGVNRNIKREWRTLHSAFGGIGLLSLPIEQLICRTTILLQHYNTSSIIGGKLTCSIHLLQLQLGTNSNPLQLSYKKFGHLAPSSWLHSFWESINKYPIELHLTYKTIPFPRQYDDTIMDFLLPHMPTAPILTSINRCRCNLNLLFLSDMTVADGTSIDSELIGINATPRTSSYAFPPEQPTRDDWLTWVDVWTRALERHLVLPQALGDWIHPSHIHWRWYYDRSTDRVFEDCDGHLHLFANDHSRPSITRSGAIYTLTSTDSHTLDGDLLPATCTILPSFRTTKHRISLCSVGPSLSIPNKLPSTFWDILEEFGGTWMWQTMHLDLDASVDWFLAALSHDSLVWVTDGSYNPLAAPDISGAGWIVKDCTTNRRWACSFYEVSENANSYRAELLGLYSIHVFVLALSRYFELLDTTTIKLRCDNKGALRTSSRRHKRIRPSSKCADILRCLRTVHGNLRVHIHYAYVASHMDDILQWHELSIEQQLNVQCDSMAKSAVAQATRSIQSGTPHLNTSLLPLEQCAIFINQSKLPSDISHPLRFECSRLKAKSFLCTQRGWTTTQFDEVDWQSLDVALSSKTTGFRIWLAKQHSNFCATRVQLHRYKEADDDKCPSCLSASENADHLCRCPNEERTQLLRDSTAELELWMSHNNNTHHELCYWIPHYILCRGQVNFCDLGPMSPEMYNIAQSQDSIGWRNFMEGRISNKITSLQRSHLTLSGSTLSVKRWMSQFISKILHITHSQWIFRNFMLHDKVLGFLRLKECTEAAIQIDSLMQRRPSSLPAESQFLLEFDTEKLLTADSDTQQYWIAAMDAALAAKHNIQQTQQTPPPRRLHSRWKASHTIAQIRTDINQQSIPPSWITSYTAVSGIGPTKPRPSSHVIQLSLPSNKKRKPD